MQCQRGLTLIETLVSLAIMAVLAVMGWRALDGMHQTQTYTAEHSNRWQAWQAALMQWGADLDAIHTSAAPMVLHFDGQVLRMVRRAPLLGPTDLPGLAVVAWTLQVDPRRPQVQRLTRWSSPALRNVNELRQAWQLAQQWARTPTEATRGGQVWLGAASRWQVFFHRGGSWSNPQSSADPDGYAVPDGVRLVISPAAQDTLAGPLTKDWVRPHFIGSRSE